MSASQRPESGGLTRGEVNRSLKSFITASGLWGWWSQAVGIGTAVFTGYALLLGADESHIALFTSAAYLLATLQILVPHLGRHLVNHKRFIVATGFAEILFRCSPALIPLLIISSDLHLTALMLLVGVGLVCGYAASPFYNTWVANTVPEQIRARFTSRQTIVSTVSAMIAGFAVGRFLDIFPTDEKQTGFTIVFAAGAVFGLLGYFVLSRAPFPRQSADEEETPTASNLLLEPFRDGNFRRAVLFYGLWIFALGIAGPMYSVFMLRYLEISYTEISVYNGLFMVASIVGYRMWAVLVDRFGSKPVLQILLVPSSLLPLLWMCNQPGMHFMVPVALTLSGLMFSGIAVAITPMMYALVPAGPKRPYYLASWSATVNLLGAFGPLTGAFVARYLADLSIDIEGFTITNLHVIFLLSAAVRVVPILLLQLVQDRSTLTSRGLLSNLLRGNFLSYSFNAALYTLATGEQLRARAARALGRSGSPLAIEQLTQALADASPVVRRSAARALGETNSREASDRLIRELIDGGSDIRPEAAESLGRLGHASSIDPLVEALEDGDPRVRISAIGGLGAIGGDEVQELLFWYFGDRFDPLTFPTLVDTLSHMGDRRVVKPALQRLGDFRSAAVRLQLMNGVCRALGAGDEFYRLLSLEDTRRTSAVIRLLRRTSTAMAETQAMDDAFKEEVKTAFARWVQGYESENAAWMEESVRQIARIVRDGLSAEGQRPYQVLSIFVIILAIGDFLKATSGAEPDATWEIFLAVCLHRMGSLVRQLA